MFAKLLIHLSTCYVYFFISKGLFECQLTSPNVSKYINTESSLYRVRSALAACDVTHYIYVSQKHDTGIDTSNTYCILTNEMGWIINSVFDIKKKKNLLLNLDLCTSLTPHEASLIEISVIILICSLNN